MLVNKGTKKVTAKVVYPNIRLTTNWIVAMIMIKKDKDANILMLTGSCSASPRMKYLSLVIN